MSVRRSTALLVAAVLGSGCAADVETSGADYGYMPDELPSGEQCDTGGGSGGSTDGCATGTSGAPPDGSAGSSCDRTSQCDEGLVCSAPFDGERGELACVGTCIDVMDEARWCADASACCDPEASCSPRGYCLVEDAESTTSDGSTSTSDPTTAGTSSHGSGTSDDTGSTGGTTTG